MSFSLEEIERIERERLDRERAARAARAAEAARVAADAERRARDERAARAEADARRRLDDERRLREEQARLDARKHAAIETARAEVEARSRAELPTAAFRDAEHSPALLAPLGCDLALLALRAAVLGTRFRPARWPVCAGALAQGTSGSSGRCLSSPTPPEVNTVFDGTESRVGLEQAHEAEVLRVHALAARRRYRYLLGASLLATCLVGGLATLLSVRLRELEDLSAGRQETAALERRECDARSRALAGAESRLDVLERELTRLRGTQTASTAMPSAPPSPSSHAPRTPGPRPGARSPALPRCTDDGDPLNGCLPAH